MDTITHREVTDVLNTLASIASSLEMLAENSVAQTSLLEKLAADRGLMVDAH